MKETQSNMEVELRHERLAQRISTVKINDKAHSTFVYRSGIYPQIPPFLSGFLTLQIALNTSKIKKNNPTHPLQKLKTMKEI